MNLVDYRRTSPLQAYEAIESRARAAGVPVAGSEVVGLIPEAAMGPGFETRVRLLDFRDDQVLERRLAARRRAGR
jgi:glutamate formiminotransferase